MHDPRIWITIAIVVFGTFLCTIGRSWFRWMADPRWWTLGESNLFRHLVFHENGDFRRMGVVIVYALMLALVWLFD
jgi:hypothetical protein